ncbi:hypothetical protein [Polaromonas sp.]|uniref:hypothetical protein n=1 Tax=Polaromonas sp. TaxID=1869339 RepID=UPI003BAD9AF8
MFYRLLGIASIALLLAGCGPKLEDGLSAFQAKEYIKAREVFQKLPDDGVSLFHLYQMADGGLGMARDDGQAIQYLYQAAAKEHPEALAILGNRTLNGWGIAKNEGIGIGYLLNAIAKGNRDAGVDLGSYYLGNGQISLGLPYLEKANSTARGKYYLGLYYSGFIGKLPPNAEIARKSWEDLVQMPGVPSGMLNDARVKLAEMYYYGYGARQDATAAMKLLEPYIQEDKAVKNLFAWLLYRGEGSIADKPRAVALWNDGFKSSTDDYASYGLALAYATGEGVPLDTEKAKEMLQQSRDRGAGTFWQMALYAQGVGGAKCAPIPPSRGQVRLGTLYQSIAREAYLGHAQCIYDTGDYRDAINWLEEAERLGAPKQSKLRDAILSKLADGWASIGMTSEQVRASKWGAPNTVNRTTAAYGTREQWVYRGRGYLYFRNGVLESIQN